MEEHFQNNKHSH